MSLFDKVSNEYKDKSLVQKSAAERLIALLKIKNDESVIDIACGPGNIAAQIKKATTGRVLCIDVSYGMIHQAMKYHPELECRQTSVEDMNIDNEFDVAFCNSALQWFDKPDSAMAAVYKCLKDRGRLGLSCPATEKWSPFFNKLVSKVKEKPGIKQMFSHWKNPWFHLPGKMDYEDFFSRQGFRTQFLQIACEENYFTVKDAFSVYLSGAANGFVGSQFYDIEINDGYVNKFNAAIKEEMEKEAKEGKVKVVFNRLYYIGGK
jgi:ubiquinone/menaquinone biosynthesis C-methylase UbiE